MSRKRRFDDTGTSGAKVEAESIEMRQNASHSKTLVEGFSRLRSEGKVCDFIIIVEGEKIPVHRAVLAASSKYYEAMVTHDTIERKNGRVEIQGVTLEAAKQCVEFMYTGKVAFSVKSPVHLIYAAELMGLPALTDMYFEFLKEKLTMKNCLKYLQLAESVDRTGGRSFAEFFKKFSTENFSDLVRREEFSFLSLSLFHQCVMAAPVTGHQSETVKWTAIVSWVNANAEQRKSAFPSLVQSVKLDCVSEEFLRETVLSEPLVNDSTTAKEMVLNALLNPSKPIIGRGAFDKEVLYIVCCRSESRMLFTFNMKTSQMERFSRIPAGIYGKPIDIVGINKEVYLTSGDAIYKFQSGKLVSVLNTGFKSEYHQCIAVGNVIYIVTKQLVCKYNTQSNRWSVLEAGVRLGEGFFISSSQNFIYAMGGEGTERTAKEFDLVAETWEPIASMQFKRKFGASISYDCKVYAFGGRISNECSIEVYSTNNDMWSRWVSNIMCPYNECKAFRVGAKVLIVGAVDIGAKMQPSSEFRNHSSRFTRTASQPVSSLASLELIQNPKWTFLGNFKTDVRLSCVVYYD